jgi:hypothetical protein
VKINISGIIISIPAITKHNIELPPDLSWPDPMAI